MDSVKKALFYISLCCISFIQAHAAGKSMTLPQAEMQIHDLFTRLGTFRDDEHKTHMADSISLMMNQALQLTGSFDYPFDMITTMGKITSADGKIRIYTWNLPWADGTNTYYGFLQYKTNSKNEIRLVALTDLSATITDPQGSTLTPDHWYGMLIYEIIEKKSDNGIYYTLLGYDKENLFLSRKVTDVLYFNENHDPVFGKPIFHIHNKFLCRILFEYSAKVQMSLKWNDKLKMIIGDHLSPLKQSYTGNYQYYGPDLSYDGLKFENGIWELVEDVDVRNMP